MNNTTSKKTLLWLVTVVVTIAAASVVLLLAGRCAGSSMTSYRPTPRVDEALVRERLFITVRQDSLQQLAATRGHTLDGPGLFSSTATITLPADASLKRELTWLAETYPDNLEVEEADGLLHLSCNTRKAGSVRYVTLPVVALLHLQMLPTQAPRVSWQTDFRARGKKMAGS